MDTLSAAVQSCEIPRPDGILNRGEQDRTQKPPEKCTEPNKTYNPNPPAPEGPIHHAQKGVGV
eukprot:9743840-Karenia_brevis.AAC.1